MSDAVPAFSIDHCDFGECPKGGHYVTLDMMVAGDQVLADMVTWAEDGTFTGDGEQTSAIIHHVYYAMERARLEASAKRREARAQD